MGGVRRRWKNGHGVVVVVVEAEAQNNILSSGDSVRLGRSYKVQAVMILSKGTKKGNPHHRNVLDDLQREKLSKRNAVNIPSQKKSRIDSPTKHTTKKGAHQ